MVINVEFGCDVIDLVVIGFVLVQVALSDVVNLRNRSSIVRSRHLAVKRRAHRFHDVLRLACSNPCIAKPSAQSPL